MRRLRETPSPAPRVRCPLLDPGLQFFSPSCKNRCGSSREWKAKQARLSERGVGHTKKSGGQWVLRQVCSFHVFPWINRIEAQVSVILSLSLLLIQQAKKNDSKSCGSDFKFFSLAGNSDLDSWFCPPAPPDALAQRLRRWRFKDRPDAQFAAKLLSDARQDHGSKQRVASKFEEIVCCINSF